MPADIVQLKIEWAEEHIDKVEACLGICLHDIKPFKFAFKDDPDSREAVMYVEKAEELPKTLPLIVGDAVSNLYSSLDYLACELVSTKEDISTQTAFPISEHVPTTRDQKSRYEGQVSGMGKEVKKLIIDMEPYRGRDNNLWTLHKLNNINKHRTLLTTVFGVVMCSPGERLELRTALQEGAELLRVPLDLPDKEKMTIFPLIAFNEPDADIANHPLLPVLRGCLRDVKRAASVLEPHRRTHVRHSAGKSG
jgi:hypothetical protein